MRAGVTPQPVEVARGSRGWSAAQAADYYRRVDARLVGAWPQGGEKRVTSAGIKLRTVVSGAVHAVELVPDGCVC